MKQYINDLCNLAGVSGNEEKIREYIISQISQYCTYEVDNLGNLIAFKRGKNSPFKKIMFCAHMDEVGFLITEVCDDGCLNFIVTGGIDPRVLIGKKVRIYPGNILGIIGAKPIHLQSKEEKEKVHKADELYIDIGAFSKEEAEKYVNVADYAVFESDYVEFGENFIKAKALDDRTGCSILIEMIKSDLDFDCFFVFNIGEEIGLAGAGVSAFEINPDIAFVIEATTAADFHNVPESKKACRLGDGAVISFMDNSAYYSKRLFNMAKKISDENNIKVQVKEIVSGGNDSGAIHTTAMGIETLAISLPCRYLHTPSSVICYDDYQSVKNLCYEFLKRTGNMI